MERRLATFVHVSDTHIGELDPGTGDAFLEASVRNRWRKGGRFYGFFGHTQVALKQFADLFARLRETEGARLVHTGDLTRLGGARQLALARRYFTQRLDTARGAVGLDDPTALDLSVPGNHDHWPGNGWVLGRPTPVLRHAFPLLLAPRRVPLAGGRSVLFAGIDSDADVWSWSPSRALARGAFRSQLRRLARRLPRPERGEVRVLLLHHSPQFRGLDLGIQRRSRAALDRFVARHHFRVLLTGHIHTPSVRARGFAHGEVLEARSGTTTLRDHLPAAWIAEGTGPLDPLPRNALLVHRLYESGHGVEWRATLHMRTRSGFEEKGAPAGTVPA